VEMVDAPSAKKAVSLLFICVLFLTVFDYFKTKSCYFWQPQTPATPQTSGSKTLFMGNLSFSIEENDVYVHFTYSK